MRSAAGAPSARAKAAAAIYARASAASATERFRRVTRVARRIAQLRRATRLTYAFAVTFAPRCPICHEPVVWDANPSRPFCSERCRLIDLGAWVTERYRVPGAPTEEHEGDDSDESGAT